MKERERKRRRRGCKKDRGRAILFIFNKQGWIFNGKIEKQPESLSDGEKDQIVI